MADISKIKTPDNTEYNIKDASVPHSRLTAVSGGVDLSLVTTDDLDKIEKINYYYVLDYISSSTYKQIGWVYNNNSPMLKQRAPLYRLTDLNANTTASANGWTSISTGWDDEIVITDFSAWTTTTNDNNNWGHLSIQWNRTNKDLRVLNIRNQTAKIDCFTVVFYKPSEFNIY